MQSRHRPLALPLLRDTAVVVIEVEATREFNNPGFLEPMLCFRIFHAANNRDQT